MQTVNFNISGGSLKVSLGGDGGIEIVSQSTEKSESLQWSNTLLDGKSVTLEEAEKAVALLGEGWRLPNRHELESLIDLSRHDPAIDTDKFPDTKSSWYWTSTPCAWNKSARWVVGFGYGVVDDSRSNLNACVRAVRASQ